MFRATPPRRLLVRVVGALTLTLGVIQPGPTGAQVTPGGPDFRISAGTSIRLDGQGPTTFGDQIGLDFRGGVMRVAWADNSGSPDLDLATAAIAVSGGGSPSVGPTVPVRVTDDQTGASLSIDPSIAGRVLAAARTGSSFGGNAGILRARSSDGGGTWVSAIDPVGVPDFDSSADLACDDLGNCFLAFLDSSDPFSPRLQLALSTNGGQSFSPVAIPETPAIDTSVAAGAGSVWLASGSTTLVAPVLGLGAVGAFSRQPVPFTGTAHKPDIAVGPGGKALVVAENLASPSFVEASVDPDGLGPAGFRTAVRFETLGAFPFQPLPQAVWDRPRDRVYVVYRGPQVSNGHEARDILLRSSSDSGLSWSSPARVNADVPSDDRLVPNVAVDPATGNVGVAWYDFRAGHGRAQLFGRVLTPAEPPPPGSPAPPANLRTTAVSRSQIDLVWEDRSGNETGFEITRSASGASPQTFRVASGTTSFADTGLVEDTTYTYLVRAFNGIGFSEPSNEASATTLDSPPSAPTNLRATAVGSDRIDLDWDPADDPDGYEIQRSLDGLAWTSLGRRADAATEATILGLAPETTYFFRVRAFNSGGDGPVSNVASARTSPAVPSAPSGLTATAVSRSRIDLRWGDTSANETRFEIQRSTSGGVFQPVATVPANTVSFAATGLKSKTTYRYQVRACNSTGCSGFSNIATATTPRR